ncbi:cAMP-regulated phosphoprotein family protein Igo1, putative [Cordyceps militaris CM01]|uniref:mRNA stability protein n=1 Tax=Cordyceps militaris (strain CM01) TaxID=983644 RepID=G3J4L4_CORMM|nr:cAMP-regulated phosphoprotein family protein Igo1, putative [Cordyceps militaris CM01]EGX95884.1 cAMP-regulated phosphoprotein family protein Igo1, putative [Cordyceps militaris CM01]
MQVATCLHGTDKIALCCVLDACTCIIAGTIRTGSAPPQLGMGRIARISGNGLKPRAGPLMNCITTSYALLMCANRISYAIADAITYSDTSNPRPAVVSTARIDRYCYTRHIDDLVPRYTMNPLLQKNKIDVKSLSPDEQRLFRLYGKLPSRSDHFAKHLKDRKYFDSGDYAMSKAGKGDSVDAGSVGSEHPVPENIPHLSSPVNAGGSNGGSGPGSAIPKHLGIGGASAPHGTAAAAGLNTAIPQGFHAGSPVKESSFLHRETSANESDDDKTTAPAESVAAGGAGIPIRR